MVIVISYLFSAQPLDQLYIYWAYLLEDIN